MKILVVDDNRSAADALASFLSSQSFEVHALYGAHDVVEEAAAFSPDVAILDIRMPDIDGFDAAARLHADPRCAAIRLLALTGAPPEGLVDNIGDAMFERYFLKPVSPYEILRQLNQRPAPAAKSAATSKPSSSKGARLPS